jgi:hypothetical protein
MVDQFRFIHVSPSFARRVDSDALNVGLGSKANCASFAEVRRSLEAAETNVSTGFEPDWEYSSEYSYAARENKNPRGVTRGFLDFSLGSWF